MARGVQGRADTGSWLGWLQVAGCESGLFCGAWLVGCWGGMTGGGLVSGGGCLAGWVLGMGCVCGGWGGWVGGWVGGGLGSRGVC